MKKIIFRTTIAFLLLFIAFIFYFSLIGFETKKFNNQISNKLKIIDDDLEINLNILNSR